MTAHTHRAPAEAPPKVLISNGFNKFHLSVAAASAARAGALVTCITGLYPTPALERLASRPLFRSHAGIQRFLRRKEQIPDDRIAAISGAEIFEKVGRVLRRYGGDNALARWFNSASMRAYGRRAIPIVEQAARDGAKIYHYRAGFGHASVPAAKRLGLYTICDHSIAHPSTLAYLIENGGRLPDRPLPDPGGFWGDILYDIRQADAVLVNSDFVRETFEVQGWSESPVHVIYLGVDDQFLDYVDASRPEPANGSIEPAGALAGPMRMLFAGSFERRKGAETCIEALRRLDGVDWTFDLAGPIHPDIRARYPDFFADPRIRLCGNLSRSDLAAQMRRADIFLFPSLAEGSARVVFEALASGTFVVTTPNAGSIVEDGVHGTLVPPGNADTTAEAFLAAASHHHRVKDVGRRNADLIRSNYRQPHYWLQLSELYRRAVA